MREILFRGKRTHNGEWVESGYCCCDNKSYIVISIRYIPDTRDWDEADYYEENPVYKPVFIEVVPKTVGQYTGLTDKNGVKIFEGDIIKDDWGKIYKVFYSPKSCSFMLECTKTPNEYETGHYRIGEAWCKTIRVIGNIYDDPELLEGTK